MRSKEELEKSNFENLTYGEFCMLELSCEKHCPLYGEFCAGNGYACYGGVPVEPPCMSFDDNDILEDKYSSYVDSRARYEKMLDEKAKKEEEKKRKNKEIAEKRRAYKWRNYKELAEIKRLEKSIVARKSLSRFVSSFVFATNTVNDMFHESRLDCPQNIKPSEKVVNSDKEVEKEERRIIELKAIIKQNEKEYRKNAKMEFQSNAISQ